MQYQITKMDALEYVKSLDDQSIDMVLTDPAYASMDKHRKIGTTTRLKKKWFDTVPNSYYEPLFKELYRVMKKNSHLYMMCDDETAYIVQPIISGLGFKFWNTVIWDKVAIGMGWHYRKRKEFILFFEKGKRKLNSNSVPDLLTCKRIISDFPTEKPVEPLEILIRNSTQEGEVVLDPFCGSSAVGEAALKNRRKFLGGDTWDEAIEVSKQRLRSVKPYEQGYEKNI